MAFDLGKGINLSKVQSTRYLEVLDFYKKVGLTERYPHFFVNGFPIFFDFTKTRIGVNLSCGADSTLMTFLLCEAIQHMGLNIKIYPLTIARHWEYNKWNEDAKNLVYQILKDKYPNIIQPQIWSMLPTTYEFTPLKNLTFPDPSTTPHELLRMDNIKVELYHFMEFNKWAARHYELDVIYNGTNTVPITKLSTTPEHRKQETLNLVDQFKVISEVDKFGAKYISANPFGLIEKDWIVAHYDYFGLQEYFDMTVSCEEFREGCNNCFHCEERQWAIDNKYRILDAL